MFRALKDKKRFIRNLILTFIIFYLYSFYINLKLLETLFL